MSSRAFIVPTGEVDDIIQTRFLAPDTAAQTAIAEGSLRRALLMDFINNDIVETHRISLDELIHRLKKSRISYNEQCLHKIYATLGTESHSITGVDLIDAYIRRVRELRALCEAMQKELYRLDELIRHSEINLRKSEAAENTSISSPIPEESVLTVQVVSIRNVKSSEIQEGDLFHLHLECQNQAINTDPQPYENDEVFWNSMFSFQIIQKEGDLHLTLFNENVGNVGDCNLLLDELADQRKHEVIKEIWGCARCDLRLSCQWIYSKKLLYRNFVKEFATKREIVLREWTDARNELNKLLSPFGLAEGHIGVAGIIAGIRDGPEFLSVSIDQVLDHMRLSSSQKSLQFVVIVLLVLSSVCSYARTSFFDLSIGCYALWCNMDIHRRWSISTYNYILAAIAGSLLFDLTWMCTFFGEDEANGLVKPEMGLRTGTKVFSLFNFMWKIVMIIFFWKCRYNLSRKAVEEIRLRNHSSAQGLPHTLMLN